MDRLYKGLLFAVSAPLFYAIKSVMVKLAPPAKLETFVFCRFFFDFLILSPFFLKYRKQINLGRVRLHLFRSFLAILALSFSIYGIKHLALADSILLESTIPLFIPIIFLAWHGKRISKGAISILLMGFFSLFLLLKPQLDLFHFASLASLGTAFLTAITSVSIRVLAETEHPIAILFYYYFFCTILSFFPFLCSWEKVNFPSFWFYIFAISVCGVFFQFANTRAFALLSPHIAGCFIYLTVFYGVLFGWIFWGESLDKSQILGGSILILSGLLIARENRRLDAVA